jgi:hypothetical protein
VLAAVRPSVLCRIHPDLNSQLSGEVDVVQFHVDVVEQVLFGHIDLLVANSLVVVESVFFIKDGSSGTEKFVFESCE